MLKSAFSAASVFGTLAALGAWIGGSPAVAARILAATVLALVIALLLSISRN